ncbi:NAD(P)-binding domain-containing protein [Corynebacterium sp. Marseille-P4321]|uniref:NAD(P)-binding domain-containing protein n=1 Tax=Corynebacterium sp. Marseille-P4321 TaxID=2736603 RepID=UPI001589A730|nr:NAD(P)-binding domain-containing protein [Corynebacterium sp. Marseille-P4321]
MAEHHTAIVVGGGQSGLATAFYLRRFKVDFIILDNQEKPGGAWLHTWPSLTLFSAAGFSNLPGWPMPPHPGYPPASHVIDYLERYEKRYELPVRRPVEVSDGAHQGGVFHLDTSAGEFTADHLVAATGTWSAPFVPHYPGTFRGKQWHSATYPGPEPFRGKKVAVVGGANSGAQIAADLMGTSEVTWFTREEPRWMPDEVDGRDLFLRSRRRILGGSAGPDLGDIVALPHLRELRNNGELSATPMFHSLDELDHDHLIWCTGFRPALGPFRQIMNGREPAVENLHLVGYGNWTGDGSATLMGVAPFAKQTAQEISG